MPQIKCETENCLHWSSEGCQYPGEVLLQDHKCAGFKEAHARTVTIEVNGGWVQSVYKSSDLPEFDVDLIDFDAIEAGEGETGENVEQARRRLEEIQKTHIQIL